MAIFTGLTAPVQARINGELSIRLNDGLFAGNMCFLVATVIMGVAVLCSPKGRAGLLPLVTGTRDRAFPWYYHLAGIIAAYYVLGMTYFAVVRGLAIYTVAEVTGQTVSGLFVDRVGFGPGGKRRITPLRLIGVILTVVAVMYAVSLRISGTHDALPLLAPVGLIVLAGILMTFQHAMNGSLAVHVRSPLPETFVKYAVGAIALVLAWLVKFNVDHEIPSLPTELWVYIGGVFGCLNLLISTVLLRRIGILLMGLSMIAGQLIGSLLLDWLLPAPGSLIHVETVLGTALTLAAIVMAAMPGSSLQQRRMHPDRPESKGSRLPA